jgi:hypothetical protein
LIHFKQVFDSWLTNEEDCWVLEHIFRFYQALNKRHVDVEALLPSRLSRLLEGSGKWYTRERGEFLRFIEQRKDEIKRANL